jgi:hypothetical protein
VHISVSKQAGLELRIGMVTPDLLLQPMPESGRG